MGAGGFEIAIQQQPVQLAGQTGARRDQTLAVFFERRHIHTGAVIKAARPAFADQFGQVLIALLGFAQQNQVIHRAHAVGGTAIIHVFADIDFTADDRVNAAFFRLGVEIDHAVHHAVVGDGAGIHAQFLDAVEQRADAVCAVQQAVFGMQMKMCESHEYAPCQFVCATDVNVMVARIGRTSSGFMRVSKEIWISSFHVS